MNKNISGSKTPFLCLQLPKVKSNFYLKHKLNYFFNDSQFNELFRCRIQELLGHEAQ